MNSYDDKCYVPMSSGSLVSSETHGNDSQNTSANNIDPSLSNISSGPLRQQQQSLNRNSITSDSQRQFMISGSYDSRIDIYDTSEGLIQSQQQQPRPNLSAFNGSNPSVQPNNLMVPIDNISTPPQQQQQIGLSLPAWKPSLQQPSMTYPNQNQQQQNSHQQSENLQPSELYTQRPQDIWNFQQDTLESQNQKLFNTTTSPFQQNNNNLNTLNTLNNINNSNKLSNSFQLPQLQQPYLKGVPLLAMSSNFNQLPDSGFSRPNFYNSTFPFKTSQVGTPNSALDRDSTLFASSFNDSPSSLPPVLTPTLNLPTLSDAVNISRNSNSNSSSKSPDPVSNTFVNGNDALPTLSFNLSGASNNTNGNDLNNNDVSTVNIQSNPPDSPSSFEDVASTGSKASSNYSLGKQNVLDIDRPKYWDIQDNTFFEVLLFDSQKQASMEQSELSNIRDDPYFDFSSHNSLINVPQHTVLQKDVPSLSFYNSLLDSKNSTKSGKSSRSCRRSPSSLPMPNNTPNLGAARLDDAKTSFDLTMSSAQTFFDWHRNPNAFYYLKLYYNFIYLKGHSLSAAETFNNVVRSLHVTPDDIAQYNKEIWSVIFSLRANQSISTEPAADPPPLGSPNGGTDSGTTTTTTTNGSRSIIDLTKKRGNSRKGSARDSVKDLITQAKLGATGIRTVRVCDNFCVANYENIANFKCSLCGSTETVELEYLSPRKLVSHMMSNPILSRSIKSISQTKSRMTNDIWESSVVKNLRAKGILNSPYDLLFNIVFDYNNTFKTSGIELIQISFMLLNLPPSEREKKESLIPAFCFPKYTKNRKTPVDVASYMQVVVDDVKDMSAVGFKVFDGDTRRHEICKAHVGFATGDIYSLNYVMGYAPRYNESPCWACTAGKIIFSNNMGYIRSDMNPSCPHYQGVYSFQNQVDKNTGQWVQAPIPFVQKDKQWYTAMVNSMSQAMRNSQQQSTNSFDQVGIVPRNPFLELSTIDLPLSFVPDISTLYYDILARKFFTLLFSRGDAFYKRSTPKSFRSSIEAHNRFCYVIDIINESMPNNWLEEPIEAEKILKGVPGAITHHQASRFLRLFPIIYTEVFKPGGDIEDKLILEFNLLMQIAISREISEGAIDFLEASFTDVVKTLESVLTSNYTVMENLSIFSPAVHATLHIASYLRSCGNLRSLCTDKDNRTIRNFSGVEEQQDLGNSSLSDISGAGSNGTKTTSANGITALQAITDTNIQGLAVRLLVPAESTMRTGSIRLLLPRKKYQPIKRSWEVLTNSEKQDCISQDDDTFFGAILFSKLNRLVWRFFKRNKTFRLCTLDPETGETKFPEQNDIFLDPENCERFRTCLFTSSNARAHTDSVIRLKSKDKARYGLAQDFIRVRFSVSNPDGTSVREMEKSLVLFTELTTQLKKLCETSEAIDPRKAFKKGTQFGPGVSSSIHEQARADKCQIVYGYYYSFPYNDKDAADYRELGRVYCDPPAEQRWDVAPVESISNPVYSIPIVSKDRRTVNVHLIDTMFNCEIQAGTKSFSIDGSVSEYDINEAYEKEIVKYKHKLNKH